MPHVMSPTGVAVLLLLALVVDWMSVGPNSIRDRLAFLMGLAAIQQGFDGSPLDRWTVEMLSALIDRLKEMAGGAYIAGAVTSFVLAGAIGVLAIYTVGLLLPDKMSGKLGPWAGKTFPTSPIYRINTRLWGCAILLGLLADLPNGLVGGALDMFIRLTLEICQPIPNMLFGVA